MSAFDLAVLAAMLGVGFFVEAVAGFGGTVVAVSLGATRYPIATVLAVFLPLNLALSAYLALRHRQAVAGRALATTIIPPMLLGLAVGTLLALRLDAERAKLGFAALVIAVAVRELWRMQRAPAAPTPAPRPVVQVGILGAAGVIHGLFATGGPLVVAIASRMFTAKATLRATLAVLWFALNLIVVGRLIGAGDLDRATLTASAAAVPALAIAMVLGEWVHARVSERGFRYLVVALLGVTGVILFVRSL